MHALTALGARTGSAALPIVTAQLGEAGSRCGAAPVHTRAGDVFSVCAAALSEAKPAVG
jgi:hypothetical protein